MDKLLNKREDDLVAVISKMKWALECVTLKIEVPHDAHTLEQLRIMDMNVCQDALDAFEKYQRGESLND